MTDNKQKTILVEKTGMEGTLEIIASGQLRGTITTPLGEKPDWADGYVSALMDERTRYYSKSVGLGRFDAEPELLNVDDLGWVGEIDEGGEETEIVEIEASQSYRMDQVAKILGIDRDDTDGNFEGHQSVDVDLTGKRIEIDEATLAEVENVGFEDKKEGHGG